MPQGVREPAGDALQVGEHPVAAFVTQFAKSLLEKSVIIHRILLLGTPRWRHF
jgi:hypothetical protein